MITRSGLFVLGRGLRLLDSWSADLGMRYTSEDHGLFEFLEIRHRGHAVVAESVEPLRGRRVLHADPCLLVEQEQVDIVQEWSVQILADLIVSSSNDNQSLVQRQEGHRVADSSTWWITLLLDFLPLSRHNFSFNTMGFEILELGQQLSLGVLATEVINTV